MTTTQDRYGDEFGGEQMWGLQELPLPEAIAYSPQTSGWFFVALAIGAALVWWLWDRRRAWRSDAWRRAALVALDSIDADPSKVSELPVLLRGCALRVAPRASVASLRGAAWIAWLNNSAGGELFAPEDAARLDRLVYAPDTADMTGDECRRLVASGRRWLREHHA